MYSVKIQARRAAWGRVDSPRDRWNPFARHASVPSRQIYGASDEEAARGVTSPQPCSTHSTGCLDESIQADSPSRFDRKQASGSPSPHIGRINTQTTAVDYSGDTLNSAIDTPSSEKSFAKERSPKPALEKSHRLKKVHSFDYGEGSTKLEQEELLKRRIPIEQQFKAVFLPQWLTINWLLLASPVGIAFNAAQMNPIPTFALNFLPIMPCTGIVIFAADALMIHLGPILGSIVNVSFCNAPQLIFSIILLSGKNATQIAVLQISLIGAILSNMLLVLGSGFFAGGISRHEQHYNAMSAETSGMMLLAAVISMTLPTVSSLTAKAPHEQIVHLSRGAAVILLVSYALYLFFVHRTHRDSYTAPLPQAEKRKTAKVAEGSTFKALAHIGSAAAGTAGGPVNTLIPCKDPENEPEQPTLSLTGAIITLALFTTLLAFHTDFSINNITGTMQQAHLSKSFVGLVIMPLFSIDPSCITAANLDKQHINVENTFNRCTQMALLVTPFLVLLAWIIGADEMTLLFNNFEVAALFMSVLTCNYICSSGKSNWLQGALLMIIYVIIALAAYYVPD